MVLDWKNKEGGFVGRAGHFTPETEIRRVLREAGFSHLKTLNILAGQLFNTFQKNLKK